MVVSVGLPGAQLHAFGNVVRIERGGAFRIDAAIEFLSVDFEEFAEFYRQLDLLDQAPATMSGR